MTEFSERTLDEAYGRSGGRCECRRPSHGHRFGRCWKVFFGRTPVVFHARKSDDAGGDARAHNCEVLCEKCASRVETDERGHLEMHPKRRRQG